MKNIFVLVIQNGNPNLHWIITCFNSDLPRASEVKNWCTIWCCIDEASVISVISVITRGALHWLHVWYYNAVWASLACDVLHTYGCWIVEFRLVDLSFDFVFDTINNTISSPSLQPQTTPTTKPNAVDWPEAQLTLSAFSTHGLYLLGMCSLIGCLHQLSVLPANGLEYLQSNKAAFSHLCKLQSLSDWSSHYQT